MITKNKKQEMQDGCVTEGADYYFLGWSDFRNIKDKGFHLRLREWKQAREELFRYVGLEID